MAPRQRTADAADRGGTRGQHDALEDTLVLALVSLARLASRAGEVDRLARLSAVLRLFGIDARACGIMPAAVGARPRRVEARVPTSPLSGREHEVAELIVQGLTNREIAEALVISERTADTHVQNILGKLGVVSRAQVAAWFVDQRPPTRRPRSTRTETTGG